MRGCGDVIILLLGFAAWPAKGAGWDYSEPDSWVETFPACGGQRQSPVDITDATPAILPITYTMNPKIRRSRVYWRNNGHTMTGTFKRGIHVMASFKGNFSVYHLHGVHFHWAANNSRGSEHTLAGQHFPAEMHLVHYNYRYGNFENAIKKDDGLLVLGVWLTNIANNDQANFNFITWNIFHELGKVFENKKTEPFTGRLAVGLMVPLIKRFYMYEGSLTTPPCSENVDWLVAQEPMIVPTDFLDALRSVRDGDTPIHDNYRPTMPLNDRTIISN